MDVQRASSTCPDCGFTSAYDVADGYCGHCHRRPPTGPPPTEPPRDVLALALGRLDALEGRLDALLDRVREDPPL